MSKNKTFKVLSILSVLFFFTGVIFFFIKILVGLALLGVCFGINIYIQKKYPDEFKQIIANGSAPAIKNTFKLKHVEGLKFVDNNTDIKISMPENKIIFQTGCDCPEILFSDIEHAAILEEITNDIKDKSVVARTLVGGLLLGGVGAVVGGLSGVMPSYKKNKKYYLQIKTKSGDDIILTGKTNVLKQIKELIIKNVWRQVPNIYPC